MKVAIIYYSETGNTKSVAQVIADGVQTVDGVEAKIMDIKDVDCEYVKEAKAVIFGTPTYYANMSWQIKKWFDTAKCGLEGKIGAAYATCNQFGGGAEIAVNTLSQHMITKGMMVYSGGTALGAPFIHVGAVCEKSGSEVQRTRAYILGQRVANKVAEMFTK